MTILIAKGRNVKLSRTFVALLGIVGLLGETVLRVENFGDVIAILHRQEITGFLLLVNRVNSAQRFSMLILHLHRYYLALHIHHLLVNRLILILK